MARAHHSHILKRIPVILVATLVWFAWCSHPPVVLAWQASSLLPQISSQDVLLIASHDGRILCKQNETKPYVPASTLKILTAMAAIHHLGESYRFRTEFYVDTEHNLKVKGYGDPLLISEVWQEIAQALASKLKGCNNLILDDSYFVRNVHIPGTRRSINPYDAPIGALCANFNTVFLKRDKAGKVVSAESQTPLTPLALESAHPAGLEMGRYTFTHEGSEVARYAGEILVHFLRESGVDFKGEIRMGVVGHKDRLLHTYQSVFTLKESLGKMLEFSNNFMANQILLALGAHVHGPPATLDKGIQAVSTYAKEVLRLNHLRMAEGSGISTRNQLSALDMLVVLKAFEPHRSLLTRQGRLLYKTGTLEDLKTRAGYIECEDGRSYYFVVLLRSSHLDMDSFTAQLAESLEKC